MRAERGHTLKRGVSNRVFLVYCSYFKRSVKQTVCGVSGSTWSGERFNVAIVSYFTKERSTIASSRMYVHVHMCKRYDRDAARSKFISFVLICEVRLETGFYDFFEFWCFLANVILVVLPN